MTKLKELSVLDSFNVHSVVPGDPANINWKMIAIYGSIAIGAAVVFACVINYSNNQTIQLWVRQVNSMNDSNLSSLAKRDAMIADLVKTIKKSETLTKTDQPTTE